MKAHILSAVAALILITGCRLDVANPAPLVPLRSVTPLVLSTGVVLEVIPDAPSTVDVVYWTDGDAPLTYRSLDAEASVAIPLAQLRPNHVYEYDVRAINGDGIPGPNIHGVVSAPDVPDAIRNLGFAASGSLSTPLVMLEVFCPTYAGFVAVNGLGEPVWHWETTGNPQGFTRRANGNFAFIDGQRGLFEVTPSGQVVHQLANAGGNRPIHHDVVATASNTLLFIAQDPQPFAGGSYQGEAIWEWNPESGTLVKRWSSDQLYDPSIDWGSRSTQSDWLHGNALTLGDHGNVILSLNWISQVISIAPDWKTIEWRVGGLNSTVAVDSAAVFQGQHSTQVLPNGHLLMFDNARDLDGAARNSHAEELSFTPGGVAHHVWSFTPSPTQYDPFVGSARRLSNGNTLVFFGMRDGFVGAVGPMAAYEVTPLGAIAWQLTYNGGDINYRATPLASIAGETVVQGDRVALSRSR